MKSPAFTARLYGAFGGSPPPLTTCLVEFCRANTTPLEQQRTITNDSWCIEPSRERNTTFVLSIMVPTIAAVVAPTWGADGRGDHSNEKQEERLATHDLIAAISLPS